MNLKELAVATSAKTGLNLTDASTAISTILELISEEVAAGERVTLAGFGTFEAKQRATRTGRHPRTGEALVIPASLNPVFRAARALKDRVGRTG